MEYVYLEEDVRGYVEGKGWVYFIVYVVDVFDVLVCII